MRHLVCAGDELAIMAAFFEERLRVGFLKIPRTDLGRRDLGRNGEHRHARSVAIKQTIDEVQIAWAATPGTDGELTGQMRLGARRESSHLLVSNVHPFDFALAPDRVGQPVQAVADNPKDPLDTRSSKRVSELIGNGFCHL